MIGKKGLFARIVSFDNLLRAAKKALRGKRGKRRPADFFFHLEKEILRIQEELLRRTYRPIPHTSFEVFHPKHRMIRAADFRDRVVHHLLVRELEQYWEPRFIYDSYACRVGKGIHSGVERLQGFMLKATRNQKRAAFFLQLDIRSFFTSIDKHILFALFRQRIESEVLLELLFKIVFHDCTENYVFKGDQRMLSRIPAQKSLFGSGGDKGLPIGNLTSQFFANVYLNELDQFVKHHLRCRFYLRYVDDFI